jgi:hypothetical protein
MSLNTSKTLIDRLIAEGDFVAPGSMKWLRTGNYSLVVSGGRGTWWELPTRSPLVSYTQLNKLLEAGLSQITVVGHVAIGGGKLTCQHRSRALWESIIKEAIGSSHRS